MRLSNQGSIILFCCENVEEVAWLKAHTDPDSSTYFGNSLAVEPRYVEALAEGVREAGFSVIGDGTL